ncbi:radical S-adenosyl methionine domain-containing protein 1 [Allomyces arbusculus]|nr:radical S-adenosyl methionine domain-containing protein 1 [Allomyces arbusculus]
MLHPRLRPARLRAAISVLPRPARVIARALATTTSASTTPTSRDPPAGIYIHFPYCTHRCTYCAFNVYAHPPAGAPPPLVEAYVKELTHALTEEVPGRTWDIKSVYFGGGTPSLAPLEFFERTLAAIHQHATSVAPDAEITVEANPSDITLDKLHAWRAHGVNRLSIGVQALDDATLRLFERDHTAQQALRAVELAKKVFPDRISLDFIWGRPGQSVRSWKNELRRILGIADGHLSLYQLTLERGTRLVRALNTDEDLPAMPSDDELADMYEATVQITAAHDVHQYEVSSFARSHANKAVHNSGYWRGHEYIGVGPGAHGCIARRGPGTRDKTYRIMSPSAWAATCHASGHGMLKRAKMTRRAVAEERVVLGLRMVRDGLVMDEDVKEVLDGEQVEKMVADGFLEWTENGVRCTRKGLAVVDAVVPRVLRPEEGVGERVLQ